MILFLILLTRDPYKSRLRFVSEVLSFPAFFCKGYTPFYLSLLFPSLYRKVGYCMKHVFRSIIKGIVYSYQKACSFCLHTKVFEITGL